MGYVRQILLFVISVAMVVVGLLLLAFDLFATMPTSAAGAALRIVLWLAITMLSFIGLYLVWEDFIASLFARRGA
jgi:hypothetical protein